MYVSNSFQIFVVARPKLSGIGEHWGVLLPDGRVAHNTPERGEHLSTFLEFACGRDVRVVESVPASEHQGVVRRVRLMLVAPRPYRAMANNCEVFKNRLVGKSPESSQVRGWLTVLGLATVAAVAARS